MTISIFQMDEVWILTSSKGTCILSLYTILPSFIKIGQELFEIIEVLYKIWQFYHFKWERYAFYKTDLPHLRKEPVFYYYTPSYQVSLKSVNNFLSYLAHRITNRATNRATNRNPDSHEKYNRGTDPGLSRVKGWDTPVYSNFNC